jgi:CO/xanthine dehydrogenase Mo-binding subunit
MKANKGDDPFSEDARAALDAAGLSRRAFIKGSGALVVGFSIVRLTDGLGTARGRRWRNARRRGSNQLDSWIAIAADGSVTAYRQVRTGHGLYTAQMQLIAEELAVPFDRVKLIQCDTSMTPDQGTTSGAQSHPTTSTRATWRSPRDRARSAAPARIHALGVPIDQLAASGGAISVKSDPSKKVGYGDLVAADRSALAQPRGKTKASSEWTVLGSRCRESSSRRWSPAGSIPSTTSACPACCTGASSGRRRSAPRSSAWTRARSAGCPVW